MYINPYSAVPHRDDIMVFIRQHGFATIVSHVASKLWASHIPLVLSADQRHLTGHLSRGNKAWRHFQASDEVLCIFQGPHAYISSSWYDHENVPTWNYMIAHVYGNVKILEGDDLLKSLKELVDKYEKHSEKPVTVEGMNKKYLETEMRGIVGIEITITEVEASFKLSQNRDTKNYSEIIKQLEKRNLEQDSDVASAMKEKRSDR
jgi:transcriptional regulator